MSFRAGRRAVLAGLAASIVAPAAFAFDSPLPRPRPGGATAKRVAAPARAAGNLPRPSGISGWMLADLESGAIVDQENARHLFAPASVAKLPTAVYALDRLGALHRFETRLAIRGRIVGGRVEGDLILAGGGDPELDTDALLPLVLALKDAGVKEVGGRFLVDCGAERELETIDPEQPLDASYNPAVSGLNLNFNRVRVEWPAKAAASDIRVTARAARLNPDVRQVRVVATGDRSFPVFDHSFEGRSEVWHMAGRELRNRGGRWLPVRRPALYAGDAFAVLAATHGITLPPAETGRLAAEDNVLRTHLGRPLTSVLADMLHHSTNLTAEAVGCAASGHPADPARSAAAMNAWAAAFAGYAPGDAGFALANHSGLSTGSRIAPDRLVAFLRAAASRPAPEGFGPAEARLPAGVAQILRPYNAATKETKRDFDNVLIAAKTGTMDYMRGLAGYIATPGGRRLAFAVFSNDLDQRRGGVSRIDRGWMARARAFEKALIRNWLLQADA